MRERIFGIVSESAIALVVYVTKPKPTLIRLASINQRPKVFLCRVLAKAMPAAKLNRLTLYPAVALVVLWGNICLLTATAVAKTVGNIVRGMIGHSKFSLLELAQATGRFAVVAVATLLVSTGVIIPHELPVRRMPI